MWNQIRQYPDGSTVWSKDQTDWLVFCDASVGPDDADAVTAGGVVASRWLAKADLAQAARFD